MLAVEASVLKYIVKVRFGSARLVILEGNEILVTIRSPPERGKANAELVKVLAHYFGVGPGRVRIISGATSRKKVVEVS